MVGGVAVREAPLEQTEHGLVCKGDGWFVVNAQDMRWYESEGWGTFSNFGGDTVIGRAASLTEDRDALAS